MILTRLREDRMRRFVEGADRDQSTLFPECLEDWIDEDNPVRVSWGSKPPSPSSTNTSC
jgi:hypothetical protein